MFEALGYSVINKSHYNDLVGSAMNAKLDWLKMFDIRTFIDIGANVGEYIHFAATVFPNARIYAFEPLKDCFACIHSMESTIPKLQAFNLAMGKEEGRTTIYRSSYAPSSSLLKMGELHKKAFPYTGATSKEEIEISSLDLFFRDDNLENDIFIKIDTQGYEDRVIDGGMNILKKTRVLQIETSFEQLYVGQVLFHDVYVRLHEIGFMFCGVRNQVYDPRDGRILQAHAYFIRQ